MTHLPLFTRREMSISAILLTLIQVTSSLQRQVPLIMHDSWKISISETWDVLGPFPIHAREQHFLSPAFPLDLSKPVDYTQTWPSSYALNGTVQWSTTTSDDKGNIAVSFPDIPWAYLRASNGWAALQHHAVIRSTLTIYPPNTTEAASKKPLLLVNLKQASYFALRPQTNNDDPFIPEWYPGDIYDLEAALPCLLPLPDNISLIEPTSFDLFISGDYEVYLIRLFGDPLVNGSDVPVQQIRYEIGLQDTFSSVLHLPPQDIIPQFVAGYPFGRHVGIALQNIGSKVLTVVTAEPFNGQKDYRLSLLNFPGCVIAPGQMRVVPILLDITSPVFHEALNLVLQLMLDDVLVDFPITLKLTHHKSWTPGDRQSVIGTFLFGCSTPSYFVTTPPRLEGQDMHPPILALHGAGVNIIGHDFWARSMPDNKYSWIVMAVGRTSWGLDWHGPSADDAWDAVRGLADVLKYHRQYHPCPWSYTPDLPVVLLGHSNGGQGTWYMASRYPDRVRAAVPAAGYIKSQAYVPLTLSRSSHFIDPYLRAILETSLTPDDNDLHISNLVDTAVLAIHGGDDKNVPSWHSRELVATMRSWNFTGPDKIYHEDFGEDHWYPAVLNNAHVQKFVDRHTLRGDAKAEGAQKFTLTTSAPQQSGSLRGWRIVELITPGRLGRLTVTKVSNGSSNGTEQYNVETSNVRLFSSPSLDHSAVLCVDDVVVPNDARSNSGMLLHFNDEGHWHWQRPRVMAYKQPPGRPQAILSSPGPITIVTATTDDAREHSVALRLAYVLQLYHRIDSEIIDEAQAMSRSQHDAWSAGNVVLIGTPKSLFIKQLLESHLTPIRISSEEGAGFSFKSKQFKRDDQSMIFTHPHPTRNDSFALCLMYVTHAGLERAARAFPYRTGIPLPDWGILSDRMDDIGAAGMLGAGVWENDWSFSDTMSWRY